MYSMTYMREFSLLLEGTHFKSLGGPSFTQERGSKDIQNLLEALQASCCWTRQTYLFLQIGQVVQHVCPLVSLPSAVVPCDLEQGTHGAGRAGQQCFNIVLGLWIVVEWASAQESKQRLLLQ